ncbi:MAG TPA: hypothetical protein VF832_01590 [Longimicrobiales bacterium]
MIEDPNSTVAILQALARALPPEAIDELWIFPPRRIGAGQSTVVVASAFEQPAQAAAPEAAPDQNVLEFPAAPNPPVDETVEPEPAGEPEEPGVAGEGDVAADDDVASDRRRILTARFTLGKNKQHQPELRHELAEHGAAPAERVGRVVDGVFRRLDDEPEPPRHARIGGERDRWLELLASLSQEPGAE